MEHALRILLLSRAHVVHLCCSLSHHPPEFAAGSGPIPTSRPTTSSRQGDGASLSRHRIQLRPVSAVLHEQVKSAKTFGRHRASGRTPRDWQNARRMGWAELSESGRTILARLQGRGSFSSDTDAKRQCQLGAGEHRSSRSFAQAAFRPHLPDADRPRRTVRGTGIPVKNSLGRPGRPCLPPPRSVRVTGRES